MGPRAESSCNIIQFPSQRAPRPVNKRPRGRPRGPRRRIVYAAVDATMVQRLHEHIYLLCTVSRSLPPKAFLQDMWTQIESIRASVADAMNPAS